MEDEDLGSRRERIFSLSTGSIRARVFDRFLFDTPFTKNGKTQGGLEDQWKRRTVLQTGGSFPALVNRLLVVKSESMEFSPMENAIGMIETRTAALRNELEVPRSSEGDQLPRLQSLQRILQGSVAVQVNSGVLSECLHSISVRGTGNKTAFSGTAATYCRPLGIYGRMQVGNQSALQVNRGGRPRVPHTACERVSVAHC
ncbi:hypothetical protein Droror1_Dr00022866 [Drosera rotundifolia]